MQRRVAGQFEVVVTDDGSTDCTAEVVRQFARWVRFPVMFTTHEHGGFRLARCRNEGARATSAPYLLFSDGDCLFPADHLQKHLLARRRGVVRSGDCLRLDEATSRRVDVAAVVSRAYQAWVSPAERRRLLQRWIKDQFYSAVRHTTKPRLVGCNVGIWRTDLEAVNGFDERFVGWGCEDDDLAERLRRTGVRIASILGYTRALHLWHPSDPSQPANWQEGENVDILACRDRPTRCVRGLITQETCAVPGPLDPGVDRPCGGLGSKLAG